MAKFDLETLIRSIVAEEVKVQLAPYEDMLGSLAKLAGAEMPRRGPGRPTTPRAAPRRAPRADKVVVNELAKEEAKRFHEGQIVRYKQGRGEFEAKVIGINLETGMLSIERTKDQKQLARPADKVYVMA